MATKSLCSLVALAAVVSVPAAAFAGAFFDRNDWLASTGAVTSPDFNAFSGTVFADGVPVDLGGNFTVTAQGGNATINAVPNFIFGFSASGLSSVTFEFPWAITSFAAVWSNTFVEDGFTVTTPWNSYDLNVISNDLDMQFIGFTEAISFNTITFTTTDDPGTDFVFFRDFEFAVPSPGTATLVVLGAGAMARRRR